ncbi:hypothetical protein Lfu02_79040 [Longispora fulva]|nr:hypothetical protein Lfu02_79040 [Longispora fulva]
MIPIGVPAVAPAGEGDAGAVTDAGAAMVESVCTARRGRRMETVLSIGKSLSMTTGFMNQLTCHVPVSTASSLVVWPDPWQRSNHR